LHLTVHPGFLGSRCGSVEECEKCRKTPKRFQIRPPARATFKNNNLGFKGILKLNFDHDFFP
jgi:hypothetical protein